MKRPPAVILAGGFGTRIRHLLNGLPKPLATVGGRPFLDWIVRFLVKQGIEEIVISAGYRADLMAEFCASVKIHGLKSLRSVAENEPMGTAGGFLNAIQGQESCEAGWLVCNGDSLLCCDFQPFFESVGRTQADAGLLALHIADSGRYGNLAVAPDSRLLSFNEKSSCSTLINAGVYYFKTETVEAFPKGRPLSFETDVFPGFLKEGKFIGVVEGHGPFIDIGTEQSLGEAEDFIQKNTAFF